jgi:hypothetical protein
MAALTGELRPVLNPAVTPGLTPPLSARVSDTALGWPVAPSLDQYSPAFQNSGEAYPPCSSHLGLTGSRQRSLLKAGPDGRGDGCSVGNRENTDNRPREALLEVFGENGLDHPGDYTGVYPGLSPC